MSLPRIWPEGQQAAVAITVNLDGESVEQKSQPLPLWGRYSYGRYGAQLGVARLLDLFARHQVRATFFVGGWDAERYPALVEAIVGGGHEVAGYGYGHEDFSSLSVEAQVGVLERSEASLERLTGQRPRGFRAPEGLLTGETRGLLAGRGYRYDSSYCDDDLPYLVRTAEGQPLVELPVHDPCTDRLYYENYRMPCVVEQALQDELEASFSEGGLYTLVLHPRGDYGSGRLTRIRALESVLQRINELPNLWIATCGEIADWMIESDESVSS